ncbi:lipid-A-disaccharide synthase [Aquisphaera insulae]|uniref:lipid-A-disaccharide synthase n=1 Tax=Aquisphaera insulae TaxID=2712864 RepID=UPI0013E9A7CD|nr:lipid-A-disaccharide synthase [Aquisphaera insulae]
MKIFVSAGEPSGDLHGANLIEALRVRLPGATFLGYGGPRMAGAGATLIYPLVNLAVMWFLQVFANIATFVWLIFRADRCFREDRPDAVILIDYPGLHWWIARRAKARGIPVFYYVPPQLWAWAGWRVKKVRKFVDMVLCSLPFEPDWYRERGVPNAEFVGHPYFDELDERELDEGFLRDWSVEARGGPLVAILAGSRTQEVKRNLPIMLRAAARLAVDHPTARFAVASLHERHKGLAEQIIEATGREDDAPKLPAIEVHAGRTPELIRMADVAWSVSGSVSLELMMEALPTVILYKLNAIDLFIARPFIKAKFITLVNLLADAEIMPEYLTTRDVSVELAAHARTWLDDPIARARATANLAALRLRVARPGASQRAAGRIADWLESRRSEPPSQSPAYHGPHPAASHEGRPAGPSSRRDTTA